MSLKCAYHPEREASEKCEKCGKVICVECKMVYHHTFHGGTQDSRYAYSRRYEVCPLCYYDGKINAYGNRIKIIGAITIIFLIIMIVIELSVFNLGNIPSMPSIFYIFDVSFLIAPILVIVAMLFMMFIYAPKKVQEFKNKREKFLNSLENKVPAQKKETEGKFCIECGKKNDPNAFICSYCGANIDIKD